jgi:hypothetical protein
VEGKAPADVVEEIVRRFGMTWEEDES